MIKCDIRWIVICIIVDYIVNIHGRSWDVAVTIGQEVNFFMENATATGRLINHDAISLNAIAYDEKTHTMYIGDKRNNNTLIFQKNISLKEPKWNDFLSNTKKEKNNHIAGLLWDTTSRNLFYIDSSIKSIMQLTHDNSSSPGGKPIEIIHLPNEELRDLALDYCTRKFYWANTNKTNPTISSSDFNGKNIKVIIDTNLYEPSALTIDEKNGKLYWIDDEEGIHYKIESSYLDGTNRKLIYHGRHQQPVSIAIDSKYIYWADWVSSTVWRIKKNPQSGEIPHKWKSFYETHSNADPTSLITRSNIEPFDCTLREKLLIDAAAAAAAAIEQENNENNNNRLEENQQLATSIEEQSKNIDKFKGCLNGGEIIQQQQQQQQQQQLDQDKNTCSCKNGFIGTYCEISICWNYCLNGECTVTHDNHPVCKCSSMYRGARCQDKIEIIENDDNTTTIMEKENKTNTFICTYNSNNMLNKTLITALSVVIGLLVILIITLSVFVIKLRKRPRIKKRFIVSKNGITPLTTRPELPRDQCEIMIENCCNMNICETPCFEPKIRSDGKRNKKEDKLSLLDAVDGNNSC